MDSIKKARDRMMLKELKELAKISNTITLEEAMYKAEERVAIVLENLELRTAILVLAKELGMDDNGSATGTVREKAKTDKHLGWALTKACIYHSHYAYAVRDDKKRGGRVMRERKTRGWSRVNGQWQWVYGGCFEAWDEKEEETTYNICTEKGKSYQCDYNTIGDFTGTLDDNGDEVYENDYVELGKGGVVFRGVAEFSLLHLAYVIVIKHATVVYLARGRDDSLFILGNIVENPDIDKSE